MINLSINELKLIAKMETLKTTKKCLSTNY